MRPAMAALSTKAIPLISPLALTALSPTATTAPKTNTMRDPITIGLTMAVMLAHDRVEQDDRKSDDETVQTAHHGLTQ
jgi:hypothetical protein